MEVRTHYKRISKDLSSEYVVSKQNPTCLSFPQTHPFHHARNDHPQPAQKVEVPNDRDQTRRSSSCPLHEEARRRSQDHQITNDPQHGRATKASGHRALCPLSVPSEVSSGCLSKQKTFILFGGEMDGAGRASAV